MALPSDKRPDVKPNFEANFLEEVERRFGLVLNRYIYVDTIAILFSDRIKQEHVSTLKRLSGHKIIQTKSRSGLIAVRIQRPNVEIVQFIDQFCPPHKVSRLDCAIDLITFSRNDAVWLEEFLDRHLSMPWRGKRIVNRVSKTKYFSSAWKRRNFVVYADKPSKITGEAALHIEFRWYGAEVCRKLGIKKVSDLVGFDPTPVMRRQSRLSKIVLPELNRTLDKVAAFFVRRLGNKTWWRRRWSNRLSANRWARDYLIRLFGNSDKVVSFDQLENLVIIQDWLDFSRKSVGFSSISRSVAHFSSASIFVGASLISPLGTQREQ